MTKVKARRTAATMRKRGKGYFPYSTIILLLKRIRDKSYVPYNTVILLFKAQEIAVSDTLHTYISFISSYKRPMPAVFQLQNNMNKSSEQNRTEQNIYLFRHSAYIAHNLNTNTAWKRKMKNEK